MSHLSGTGRFGSDYALVGHDESMYVIFNPSDLKRSHLVLSSDAADVGPNAFFKLGEDPRFSILGAESEMVM